MMKTCSCCGGEGKVKLVLTSGTESEEICWACNGKGYVANSTDKARPEKESLKTVPARPNKAGPPERSTTSCNERAI